MRSTTTSQMLLAAAALAVIALAGCGGDGGPGGQAAGTGSVQGRLVNLDTDLGVAGVTVTIGGRSATTASDGVFLITRIAPGNYDIIIDPTSGYEVAGGVPIRCDVVAGFTTSLVGTPIMVVPTGGNPPGPA